MAHQHVPTFGNWDNGDNIPYTAYFEKARQGRTTGKMINPNDPQENPEVFSKTAPQAQAQAQPQPQPLPQVPKSSEFKHFSESPTRQARPRPLPQESIVRGPARPNNELKTSRESSEFKHFSESPARGAHGSVARPITKSVGSENSFEKSPHHRHYQAKLAVKGGGSSPAWDRKSSYDSSHGTPERSRMRPANRGRETPDRAATVPKFGEWDENNPSSADGYTDIFKKVLEEKHNEFAMSSNRTNEPSHSRQNYNDDKHKKCCCFSWGRK